MAYVKIIYQNSPSTATPINAQNLNHMDDGIAENDRRLNELETAGVVNKFNGRSGNVTPTKGDYDIADIGATDGQDGYVPVWRNSGTEEDPNWGFEMEQQGGSGHKILDADGSEMAQEDSLQFADSFVFDDDVNGRTVVENVKEVASADYPSETEDGMYLITDGEGAVIGPASDDYVEVEADGVKTYQTLLNEIYNDAKFDLTKLTNNSLIVIKPSSTTEILFHFERLESNKCAFTHHRINDTTEELVNTIWLDSSNSKYYASVNGTITDYSTSTGAKLSSGATITLYYGNKKATVDLQTTANRCWYDSNTTVKDRFKWKQLLSTALTTTEASYTLSDSIANYNELIIAGCWIDGGDSVWMTIPIVNGSISFDPTTLYLNNDSSGSAYDMVRSISGNTIVAYGANTYCWLRVYAR